MNLGGRAVDHLRVGAVRSHQGFEQALPKATPRPSIEAVVDRRRGTVERRTVFPAAADFQDMHDPADDAPIIDATGARLIVRKQRLDHRLTADRSAKTRSPSQSSIVRQFESSPANDFNALIEFSP
jgi:hypothetical protein